MTTLRWGIAGPGKIAHTIATAFSDVPNGELVAVGSRARERAEAFASMHTIPRAHGSYQELCDDPAVDAIYIATPHPQHTDIALAAIAAGKHVLVEKAFTSTVADTTRIIEAARSAGVFCMEAMWTRFNPGMAWVREVLAQDGIGDIRGVHGDLTAYRAYDPEDRLFDPDLGGGALLDLGVYVLSFVQHILGAPERLYAVGSRLPNGVEGDVSILLQYANGVSSTLTAGFTAYGPGRMMILGSEGWFDLHPRFHRGARMTLWRGKEEVASREFASGYEHELIHVGECVARGLTESPIMPLADTLAVQELMAEVGRQIGVGA